MRRVGLKPDLQGDLLPRHVRRDHLDVVDLAFRDLEVIAVDEDEVGPLARLQRAGRVLHVRGVCGIGREQAQRFLARQLLLRIPAARRAAIAILARDGCVQAVERIRQARPGSRCRPRGARPH